MTAPYTSQFYELIWMINHNQNDHFYYCMYVFFIVYRLSIIRFWRSNANLNVVFFLLKHVTVLLTAQWETTVNRCQENVYVNLESKETNVIYVQMKHKFLLVDAKDVSLMLGNFSYTFLVLNRYKCNVSNIIAKIYDL